MRSRMIYSLVINGFITGFLLLLSACSDSEKENDLVDLFTVASLDLVEISFPADNETLVSTGTFVDYHIEGLKTGGTETIPVTDNISWSLSEGASSTIDQNGRLTTGTVAEQVTITAKVGYLTTRLEVTVSSAKFDRVVQLSSTPVSVNMCQAQNLKPVGRYVNEDGTEEIRAVDNTVINSITWLIRNQEDDSPSQRAIVKTENSIARLQALEAGNVIIQAQAKSLYSGTIVTSADFSQTLDNNLISLKLCRKTDSDLAGCTLSSADILENEVLAIMAVGEYQAADGSRYRENISALSKWGIDNSNAGIALSADRQQLDITGIKTGASAVVSAACGKIEQTITDSDIKNGVVLDVPVTCATSSTACLRTDATINIRGTVTLDSLTVTVRDTQQTVNETQLVDNTELVISNRPIDLIFRVTANYSDGSSSDVTADTATVYNNITPLVISEIQNSPGEYLVLGTGIAEIQITFESQGFTARINLL